MSAIPKRLLRAATLEVWAERQEHRQAVLEERVKRAAVAWLDAARGDVSQASIRSALGSDDPRARIEEIVGRAMEDNADRVDLEGVADDVAQRYGREVAQQLGIPTKRIDAASVRTRASRWAADYQPALAGEVSDETKRAVGDIVSRGVREGQADGTIANRVKEVIGLTERDALAVERVREKALEDGKTQAEADRVAERYADQKRAQRAEAIAQTETQRAAAAGRDLLWEDLAESGLVDRDRVVRIWVTMEDEKVCPICGPLHEKEAKMGEPFRGGYDSPPAHPRCRCKAYFEARGGES